MKFLKTFFSKIKSLWSSLVGGKKPSGTEPLLQNSAPTPEPTPVGPNLIVQASVTESTPVDPSLIAAAQGEPSGTEPLLQNSAPTPEPTPVGPNLTVQASLTESTPVDPSLIAAAQDALKAYLPPESRISLRGTCRTLFSEYKMDPNEKAISELASRVLWNRPSAVTQILEDAKDDTEKLKRLLTNSVTMPVILPSGLLFKDYTPFQAALCTWNTTLCEEFKKYFAQIPNGLAIMQAQITQIFPEGVEAYIEKLKADAEAFKTNTLRPLIESINAASYEDVQTMLDNKQSNSDLGKAMTAFREKIKTLSGNEPVHNPFYLQAGFDLYVECFDRFRRSDQRALFCIQGIGCIQCYSPACDLQAFAQGLRNLVEEQKPFVRSFEFTNVWHSTPRLEIKDFSGLGFDYWAVVEVGGAASDHVACNLQAYLLRRECRGLYSRFLSSKNNRLYEFCAGRAAAGGQFRNAM